MPSLAHLGGLEKDNDFRTPSTFRCLWVFDNGWGTAMTEMRRDLVPEIEMAMRFAFCDISKWCHINQGKQATSSSLFPYMVFILCTSKLSYTSLFSCCEPLFPPPSEQFSLVRLVPLNRVYGLPSSILTNHARETHSRCQFIVQKMLLSFLAFLLCHEFLYVFATH